MRKNLLLLIALIFQGFYLRAQPVLDILNFRNNYYIAADQKSDPNATITQRESSVNLFLPLPLKTGNVFFAGFDYYEQQLHYQSDTAYYAYLNLEILSLGYIHQWNNSKWKTTFVLSPKVGSNLETVEFADYQLGGVVLMCYEKRKKLKYKLGVYYNREFFGNTILPLAGIDWKLNNRIYIYGVLPGSMNFEYRLAPGIYTGMAYKNITASYRLNHGPDDLYIWEGHKVLGDNHLSMFFQFYPYKYLVIYAAAGMTLWRQFQLYGPGKQKLEFSEYSHKVFNSTHDKGFVQIGAAFRLRMDKDYDE